MCAGFARYPAFQQCCPPCPSTFPHSFFYLHHVHERAVWCRTVTTAAAAVFSRSSHNSLSLDDISALRSTYGRLADPTKPCPRLLPQRQRTGRERGFHHTQHLATAPTRDTRCRYRSLSGQHDGGCGGFHDECGASVAKSRVDQHRQRTTNEQRPELPLFLAWAAGVEQQQREPRRTCAQRRWQDGFFDLAHHAVSRAGIPRPARRCWPRCCAAVIQCAGGDDGNTAVSSCTTGIGPSAGRVRGAVLLGVCGCSCSPPPPASHRDTDAGGPPHDAKQRVRRAEWDFRLVRWWRPFVHSPACGAASRWASALHQCLERGEQQQ